MRTKSSYNPSANVVFVGPYVAKKAESWDEKLAGIFDTIITFADLKEMFAVRGIKAQ